MDWNPSLYAFALIVCALITGGVALDGWRHRTLTGTALTFLLLGATVWSLGYGVALGTHDLAGRILWAKVQHLGIAMMPASAVAFALRYTGGTRWQTRRNIALMAVVPFVGMLLAWTNEAHGLIWANIEVARDLVVENMSEGVMVLDAWARIVDANPAALKLIRRPADQVIGQPVARIVAGRPDLLYLAGYEA